MRTPAMLFLVAALAGCTHDKAAQKPPAHNGLVEHEAEIHQHLVETHSSATPVDGGAPDGP